MEAPPNYQLQHTQPIDQGLGFAVAVQFSPDGSLIATGSSQGHIHIWHSKSGELKTTIAAHDTGINDLKWSHRGEFLLSASNDQVAKLWDVQTETARLTLKGHDHYIGSCCLSRDGAKALTGGYDESLRLWDLSTGSEIRSIPAHSDPVTGVDWHKKDTEFASCSFDGVFRQWDSRTSKNLSTRHVLTDYDPPPLTCINYAKNGKFLLLTSLDSSLTLWSTQESEKQPKKVYPSAPKSGHENVQWQCRPCFALASLVVMGCEKTCKIYVYGLNSKETLQVLPGRDTKEGHSDTVFAVDAHGDNLASIGGPKDRTIKIWTASKS